MERVIAEDGRKAWAVAIRFSAVGFELVLGVGLGYWLGSWLDARYESYPTLTLLCLLLGAAVGFAGLARVVRQYQRELERQEEEEKTEESDD
ncbi:MAG: AtpZ/AtpI family protein [Deltaproteobacteria bacterium]|nr:AtpZ/AtpI family protein [Deltaproteobacteria bacterium]